jgi:predicted aspartyl protease
MKFDYLKLLLSQRSDFFGSTILKPIIPIKISSKNQSLRYGALIDSGADFCIFDAEIGKYLGLDIYAGKKEIFGGIQDKDGAEAFLHEVIINIGGWEYKTIVGFSYDIAKHGFGILGQKGFFDIFIVKFDLLKEEIELKERIKR